MVLPSCLETPRLRLRPLSAVDAGAVVRGCGDLEVSKWLTVVPHPYHMADALEFIAGLAPEHSGVWGIEGPAGFAGVVSLTGELGYWLMRDAWGQGYMSEAVEAVVSAHFADPSAGAFRVGHFADNQRSARVIEKLGAEVVGFDVRRSRATGEEALHRMLEVTREGWLRSRPA